MITTPLLRWFAVALALLVPGALASASRADGRPAYLLGTLQTNRGQPSAGGRHRDC